MAKAGPIQEHRQLEETPPQGPTADDYLALRQKVLVSLENQYRVIGMLGRGTFGLIVRCSKIGRNEVVAIKVLKNDSEKSFKRHEEEVSMLAILKSGNAENFNMIRYYESLTYLNNTCLVFELLDENIYEFLKRDKFKPMKLKHIRPIVHQIMRALIKLKELRIIHADLKPENIMLVDSLRQPCRVKLIDFGSAMHEADAGPKIHCQSRFYRSPEIILGLPFSQAIDIWSLACVMVELFLAWPLYPGPSEYHQISFICHTQGLPSQTMLSSGLRKTKYFIEEPMSSSGWRLKNPEEFKVPADCEIQPRKYVFQKLDQIADMNLIPTEAEATEWMVEMTDLNHFVDLIKCMLEMDPNRRITHSEILQHPFMTLTHLQDFSRTNNFKESNKLIQFCKQ